MKKWLRLIISLILLVAIFFSTTGFVLYESVCSCFGDSKVSFTSDDASCNCIARVDEHHESECPVGNEHHRGCELCNTGCHCGLPIVHFFKMENQGWDEIPMLVFPKADVQIATLILIDSRISVETELASNKWLYYPDPPPLFDSANEFLTLICQHKIPSLTC